MTHSRQFYIDGAWVEPQSDCQLDVIDPSTEEAFARIACGSKADVDRAVAAARQAFRTYSLTSPAERGERLCHAGVSLFDLGRRGSRGA